MNMLTTNDLNALLNGYRGSVARAQVFHKQYLEDYDIQHLVDESNCYKTASEICGVLAQHHSTNSQVRSDWLDKQAQADEKIQELYRLANNIPNPTPKMAMPKYVPAPAEPEPAEPVKEQPAAPKKKADSKKSKQEEQLEEDAEKWITQELPSVKGFPEVAGMDELLDRLRSCLPDDSADAVKDHMGVSRINGIFLYGPPGCGKTHCIKAFIYELMKDNDQKPEEEKVSYIALKGSDIHDKYVGGTEKRIQRAFQLAMDRAPSILFIDEIENVCRNRNSENLPGYAWSATAEFLNMFNALVDSKKKVFFIGATNYPNMVEGAMLDRVRLIPVPLPDTKAREKLFHMRLDGKLQLEEGFTMMEMAEELINFSSRDFNHLVEELTNAMIKELKPLYHDDKAAMLDAMVSGKYPLRRELFLQVLENFTPSKKDEMIRSLDAWDSDFATSVKG